jgi:hypothetical protein
MNLEQNFNNIWQRFKEFKTMIDMARIQGTFFVHIKNAWKLMKHNFLLATW